MFVKARFHNRHDNSLRKKAAEKLRIPVLRSLFFLVGLLMGREESNMGLIDPERLGISQLLFL